MPCRFWQDAYVRSPSKGRPAIGSGVYGNVNAYNIQSRLFVRRLRCLSRHFCVDPERWQDRPCRAKRHRQDDTAARAGGYEYEQRISQVLYGLGFTRSEWNLSIGILSGGQKTRALLARLLLEKPDLLILDEPTNHLDVQAVEWLEGMLRTWDGALLIVSHDRYFLDRIATRILFLGDHGVESFNGSYSEFYDSHHGAKGQKAPSQPEKPVRVNKPPSRPEPASTNRQGRRSKGPSPAEIESMIHAAEADLQLLAARLATEEVSRHHQQLIEISRQYEETESKIRDLYAQWEESLELVDQ